MNEALFKAGKYFGYPDCCVKEFHERIQNMGKSISLEEFDKYMNSWSEEQKLFRQGFVPCKKHAKEVKPGEERKLITNRICKKPFPDAGKIEDFEKYLSEKPSEKEVNKNINQKTNKNQKKMSKTQTTPQKKAVTKASSKKSAVKLTAKKSSTPTSTKKAPAAKKPILDVNGNPVKMTTRTALVQVVNNSRGKFITTVHEGKDKELHTINGIRYKLQDNEFGYIKVYSTKNREMRLVNPQTLMEVRFKGETLRARGAKMK